MMINPNKMFPSPSNLFTFFAEIADDFILINFKKMSNFFTIFLLQNFIFQITFTSEELFAVFSTKSDEQFLKPISANENENLKKICGKTTSTNMGFKIIGGDFAAPGQFPWAVSFVRPYKGIGLNRCGGTLISRRHILTAAHCFHEGRANDPKPCNGILLEFADQLEKLRIWYGGICLGKNAEEGCPGSDMKEVKIAKVALPLNFLLGECHFLRGLDYAILELEEELEFNQKTMSICLPSPEFGITSADDHTLIDLGWGYTGGTLEKPKRSAKLRFFHSKMKKVAADHIKEFFIGDNYIETNSTNQQTLSGLCPGDSGAALQATFNERVFLLGIHSKATPCFVDGKAVVMADNVQYSTFVPRIAEQICRMIGVCARPMRRHSNET